jgi:hypothetical protein
MLPGNHVVIVVLFEPQPLLFEELLFFRVSAGLRALVMCQVAVACRSSCKFRTASWAVGLGCCSGLFALVSQ